MRLHFVKAHRLNQLHDEILAALPAFRTTLRVEGLADNVWLTVPDDTGALAIEAAVEAHVLQPLPVPPPPPGAAALTALRQIAQSSGDLTPAQLSQGPRALIALTRYRTGDV